MSWSGWMKLCPRSPPVLTTPLKNSIVAWPRSFSGSLAAQVVGEAVGRAGRIEETAVVAAIDHETDAWRPAARIAGGYPRLHPAS